MYRISLCSVISPGLVAALAIAAVVAAPGREEKSSGDNGPLRAILAQLQSQDWKVRQESFYELIGQGGGDLSYMGRPLRNLLAKYPQQAEDVRLGLIRLLERENAQMKAFDVRYKKTGQLIGQDYDTDYYANVIAAVASLKDLRSINAMLGAITTGDMAMRTLAELAPSSLKPVLLQLKDEEPLVRSSALDVLRLMISGPHKEKVSKPASLAKIKRAFWRGASDPEDVVRVAAVAGLAALGDADAMPLLQKIAESDPSFYPEQGRKRFWVRRHAQEALAELKSKLPPQHKK